VHYCTVYAASQFDCRVDAYNFQTWLHSPFITENGLDGFALRDKLRTYTPSIRTIFLTRHDLGAYTEALQGAHVLRIPVPPEQLLPLLTLLQFNSASTKTKLFIFPKERIRSTARSLSTAPFQVVGNVLFLVIAESVRLFEPQLATQDSKTTSIGTMPLRWKTLRLMAMTLPQAACHLG
jgi:hypothetical protein